MLNLALSGMEAAINRYLRLDPDALNAMETLKNKTIKIELTDINLSFFVTADKNGMQLLSDTPNPPNTTIKGTTLGLFNVQRAGGASKSLFKNKIDIEGDTHTAEQFRSVLSNIDIDWEEHLSHLVGDAIAHQAAEHTRKGWGFIKKMTGSLSSNIKDYFHHEANITPTQEEVEDFINRVGKLRNDVDRAEARINHLLQSKQTDEDYD